MSRCYWQEPEHFNIWSMHLRKLPTPRDLVGQSKVSSSMAVATWYVCRCDLYEMTGRCA